MSGVAAQESVAPASLLLRVTAMVYDALLLFGVLAVVSYSLLAALGWSYPLTTPQRAVFQGVLFLAIGAYFVICWSRSGQTLALKTWRLKVVGDDGRPPTTARAVLRYLAAWHLWLPGIALAATLDRGLLAQLMALGAGFVLMLMPALADRDRRLLHDRWTATRVVRTSPG